MSEGLYCGKIDCKELEYGCSGLWCLTGETLADPFTSKAQVGSTAYCAETFHKRGGDFSPVKIKLVSEFEWKMKLAIQKEKLRNRLISRTKDFESLNIGARPISSSKKGENNGFRLL